MVRHSDASMLELWPWASIYLYDGRTANRGWIQESPEPVSFDAWGNAADVHPRTAARLNLADGDEVELAGDIGSVCAPLRVTSDVAEGAVAVSLGRGHTHGRIARGVGANAFALFDGNPDRSTFGHVKIRTVGTKSSRICVSASQNQAGRDLLQWTSVSSVRPGTPDPVEKLDMPLPEGYDPKKDVYEPHEYANHRWAMAADLQRCIGCGACATACYAENNIAVAGAAEVAKGREMAWLQVVPYRREGGAGRLGWLPLPCQQCDAAPCEPVCPVFASVHNEEGLNAQVYNRCIGTRYCSNNCPYKVRRFNWLNRDWDKPLDMQLNPDVTVRKRGVMEKCTFCIQRIRRVERLAKREGRGVRDGEIQPACVQTCPTRALVFGDLMDAASEVSGLVRKDPRRYQVLEELNTKPAVIYLKRILLDELGSTPAGGGA
jgi:molybdopterin-containing oxidoreductase family iron-sulfur binding subunit